MANLWLDLKGPILADTVYVDGVLAAKDVTKAKLLRGSATETCYIQSIGGNFA